MTTSRRFSSVFILFLISIFCLSFGCALADEMRLKELNGREVNLSAHIAKQPVLLFFWTTWCPYCRKEIKELDSLSAQLKKDGLLLFAVNIAEPSSRVEKFFRDYPPSFGVLLDEEARLSGSYDIIGVPTYILLDKAGKEVYRDNSLPHDYKALIAK